MIECMVNTKFFFVNPYHERTCIVWDSDNNAVIIDPGFIGKEESESFLEFISSNSLKPLAILLTHAHFDHIYGVKTCIEQFSIPVYMHPQDKVIIDDVRNFAADARMPVPDTNWETIDIHEGESLRFGGLQFEVIETPGHTPGSVCYLDRQGKNLFSGDTLFAGSIGNTSLRWGDYDKEIVSIMEKLMFLDGDTAVRPGHGGGSTIGHERTTNPFLQPFNEKYDDGSVDGITFNE